MSTMHTYLDAGRRAQLAADPHEYVRADQVGTTPADVVRAIRRLRTQATAQGLADMLGALATHVNGIVDGGLVIGMDDVLRHIDRAHDAVEGTIDAYTARAEGLLG